MVDTVPMRAPSEKASVIRMAFHRDAEVHPKRNPVLQLTRRVVPMTSDFGGEAFIVRRAGKLVATPLFAVIIVVMTADVVFAVGSIPAIFAITSSGFVVWTANAFAVLGLRRLYFMLASVKFMISEVVGKVSIWVPLPFIAAVVTASILVSLWKTRGQRSTRPCPARGASRSWGLMVVGDNREKKGSHC